MRHTRIIATLGPSTNTPDAIDALVAAGVDIFRLNFSHGTHETHAALVREVRRASASAGRYVAILQDLPGPKIRIGRMPMAVILERGARFRLETGDFDGDVTRASVAYAGLISAARPGDRLVLDDGRIELVVRERADGVLDTEVVNGGRLTGSKGINAPGVSLPPSAVTERDAADLRFGATLGIDIVALSFVQTADDVTTARRILHDAGRPHVPIVAKIERPQALPVIDEILDVADGLMVARGDLGLEMPLERVPAVQKDLVRRARREGVPVIVATQVFDSMRTEPRPTRAEVSDAANAVEDGADAIMLSDETAAGAFPIRAVEMLDAVIREAEAMPAGAREMPVLDDPIFSRHGRALCEAAVTLARGGQADAIVAVTRGGKTARLLSAFRPAAPILAATPSEATAARLSLLWGVTPVVLEPAALGGPANLEGVHEALAARGLLAADAVVVFVRVSAELGDAQSNFLHLQRMGNT
ncbi:MAG: pyruvate kinase [Acidobacteriota bacterium]|nr:pyruvate kinase [Acidobacteriota bacterium]